MAQGQAGSGARWQYGANRQLMFNTDMCLLKNITPDEFGRYVPLYKTFIVHLRQRNAENVMRWSKTPYMRITKWVTFYVL